jgi:hypothetical protein
LEEVLTKFGDIFATDSDDYGWTERVYHSTDTGEARPIREPPRGLLLAKQEDVSEKFKDV